MNESNAKNESIKVFAYVPHGRRHEFESLGWEFAGDLGPPHCFYASLYRWHGDDDPPYPGISARCNEEKTST